MKNIVLTYIENLGFSFDGILLGINPSVGSTSKPRKSVKYLPGEKAFYNRKIMFSRFLCVYGYIEVTNFRLLIYKRSAFSNDKFYSISFEDIEDIIYTNPSFWERLNLTGNKIAIVFTFNSARYTLKFYRANSYNTTIHILFGLNGTNYSSNPTVELYEDLLRLKNNKHLRNQQVLKS